MASSSSPGLPTSQSGAFDSQELLRQILQAVQESAVSDRAGKDTRSQFWATYNREAGEYDAEFLDKYKSDMDIVLIFAGLFSAVSTSFIVGMEPSLSPNPSDTTNALLMMLVHAIDNSTFSGQVANLGLPPWHGPGLSIIWIQTLMYASLSTSLLAALGAMLGKQWLSHFQRSGRGTIGARGRRRQQKLDGLQTWHFDAVLEALPALLQISLLLFAIALAANIWAQQRVVASVIVGTTALGVLFYISIVVSSLTTINCPFQTPASNILRMSGRVLLRYFNKLQKQQRSLKATCAWYLLYVPVAILHTLDSLLSNLSSHTLSRGRTSSPEHLDAPSIRWLLETSTDPDVVTTAAYLVPEVEWPPSLDVSTTLVQLRDTFLSCFEDTQYGQPTLVKFGRERALACGKAFVHLYIERRSFDERPILRQDDITEPILSAPCPSRVHDIQRLLALQGNDPELSFICSLILEVTFDDGIMAPISLRASQIPNSFLPWMSHCLPHCLLQPDCSRFWSRRALDAVTRMLVNPLPPSNILANCLMAASLLLDHEIDSWEFVVVDKSPSVRSLLISVLERMQQSTDKQTIRLGLRDRSAIYTLKLLEPVTAVLEVEQFRQIAFGHGIAEWGLQLCQRLVQSITHQPELGSHDAQDRVWKDARAALHLSIVTACARDHELGDERTPFSPLAAQLRGKSVADCSWLVDCAIHHHQNFDESALIDVLLATSEMNELGSSAKVTSYLETIVFAMGSDKSPRLRDAALRAVHSSKKALGSLAKEFFSPTLRLMFSRALKATVSPDTSLGRDISDDGARDEATAKQNLRYLQILLSLVEDCSWAHQLRKDGHLDICLAIANEIELLKIFPLKDQLALYTVLTLSSLVGKGDSHKVPDGLYTSLLDRAWYFAALRSNVALGHPDHQIDDILQPLTKVTMTHFGQDAGFVADTLEPQVKRTLEHLAERNAATSAVSLGENIRKLMQSPSLSSQSGQVDASFHCSRYRPSIDTTGRPND